MYTFNLLKFFIILYFLNFMKTIAVLKIKIYQNENKKKKKLSECKDGKRKRNGGQSATHIPTESLKRASLAST